MQCSWTQKSTKISASQNMMISQSLLLGQLANYVTRYFDDRINSINIGSCKSCHFIILKLRYYEIRETWASLILQMSFIKVYCKSDFIWEILNLPVIHELRMSWIQERSVILNTIFMIIYKASREHLVAKFILRVRMDLYREMSLTQNFPDLQ